jgi:hypothetical protein
MRMSHVLRPDTTGDGASGRNEIEVTREMLDAGEKEFLSWNEGCEIHFGDARTAVESIFRVMISAARLPY